MTPEFRAGETITRSEREFDAWLAKAERLTGLNLLMSDEALIAYEDGLTPQQFAQA